MGSSCVCRICEESIDCDELLCPRCEEDYKDEVYGCPDGHCHVDLAKIAQRIRRIKESKIVKV